MKTDRILGHLPRTFRAFPRPTALYTLANTFGSELVLAENSLAEILRAHWVDHADRGTVDIDDLARLAALYGLAPRSAPMPEESVEEFRQHLKRYVRTFLEGTTSVKGVLRVAAEALGFTLDDDEGRLDPWWRRADDRLTVSRPRADDAASRVFGTPAAVAAGRDAARATIHGVPDLRPGVDLRGSATLGLTIDGGAPVAVNCAAGAADPARVQLTELVSAINSAAGPGVAQDVGGSLVLRSPTTGPTSRIVLGEPAGDAAPMVLGLAPRTYRGSAPTRAAITGTLDLVGGVSLDDARFVRIAVDRDRIAEVDCRGSVTGLVSLVQIATAINTAFGVPVATHDGHRLTLASPTTGSAGSVALQAPAAQDATAVIFGDAPRVSTGSDAGPARVISRVAPPNEVDLRGHSKVNVGVDGGPPVTVECAGADAARTTPQEIVAALNRELAPATAGFDGTFLRIRSGTNGPTSALTFHAVSEAEDATPILFGIGRRDVSGQAATPATISGTVDLRAGLRLSSVNMIGVAVDGGNAKEIDLRSRATDPTAARVDELVTAINAAVAIPIASHDGSHISLVSPTTGESSRLEIVALAETTTRRFVTRAFIADDAAELVLGAPGAVARGVEGAAARLIGTVDLSRGADLRINRFLRVSIDGAPPIDVDCIGATHVPPRVPRPRVALLDEIVAAIDDVAPSLASHDGRHLILTSPTVGAASRIRTEPPRGLDALDRVLALPPGTYRGSDAKRVTFTGTVDLGAGVDLSTRDAVKIGIDGIAPVEVGCAGLDPAHTTAAEIIGKINSALGIPAALEIGGRIVLVSPTTGTGSRVVLDTPAAPDATDLIFGVSPRSYHGTGLSAAVISGTVAIAGGVDLTIGRILRISVNAAEPIDVDCAAGAVNSASVTLPEIVSAIGAKITGVTVDSTSGRLRLTTAATGSSASLTLVPYNGGDARGTLLGADVPNSAGGADAAPAVIEGLPGQLAGLDLGKSPILRLAIDGDRPLDIDISGQNPPETGLAEVVARINAAVPGVASLTPTDALRLASRQTGSDASLEITPTRWLELIEYPSIPADPARATVRHGDTFVVHNDGAAETSSEVTIIAPSGAAGPAIVNRRAGVRVRLMTALTAGESVRLRRDEHTGLRAELIAANGTSRTLPPSEILAGTVGTQLWVPFANEWPLTRPDRDEPPTLQLNDPPAPSVVVLRSRRGEDPASTPVVGVVASPVTPAVGVAGPHARFDVTIRANGVPDERYKGVSIGWGADDDHGLVNALATSQLVSVRELDKGAVLDLAVGDTELSYMDCYGARFDRDRFDAARFAGGICYERGVFDVSRFAHSPPEPEAAVFAPSGPMTDPPVDITVRFERYEVGAFTVNLPADLPDYFGARFDAARYGGPADVPEVIGGVVNEPASDPDLLVTRINAESKLVTARVVQRAPIGFAALPVPFRRPRTHSLSNGSDTEAARLFVIDRDVPVMIELAAREPGAWGNGITVSVRPAGPGRFDVIIAFAGGRFESACHTALGIETQPASGAELLQPTPVGVLHAKASGVWASVTRDRAWAVRAMPPHSSTGDLP